MTSACRAPAGISGERVEPPNYGKGEAQNSSVASIRAANAASAGYASAIPSFGRAIPEKLYATTPDTSAWDILSVPASHPLSPASIDDFRFHFKAGLGGYPLIGTPEQIVDGIEKLSRLGVDGILISWVDYLGECRQWIDEVLPLMEQAGLRKPFGDPR